MVLSDIMHDKKSYQPLIFWYSSVFNRYWGRECARKRGGGEKEELLNVHCCCFLELQNSRFPISIAT